MDEQQDKDKIVKKEIHFPNGNTAQLVAPPVDTGAHEILNALGIDKPEALLVVTGGAGGLDDSLKPRLIQLFSRGIARGAAAAEAMIIDGGTRAGVMEMMGQGVADRERRSVLLGVAPAGKVAYPGGPGEGSIENGAPLDPNHSHFVLVESDQWGGETDTMYQLAEGLAEQVPVVTILANGGDIARDEVLRSVRNGWSVIVIEGSGRLADEIADLWKKRKKEPVFIEDPIMAEIVAEGSIYLLPLDREESIAEIERMVIPKLRGGDSLKLAWEHFALYDDNAKRHQRRFHRLQFLILTLGVFATLLALAQTQLVSLGYLELGSWHKRILHYTIIVVPITISILFAASNYFKSGSKWVLLRAGAETIKQHIYRYRAYFDLYSNQPMLEMSPEERLAQEVESIRRQVIQTDVNLSALQLYNGVIPPKYAAAEGDDGLSSLPPDRYVELRLEHQLKYYQKTTAKLDRKLKVLRWLIYVFGGVGTLLAAVGLELWIALTTALVAAFTTFLEYRQIENTLIMYNQAANNLGSVRAWWVALPAREKSKPENIGKLVEHTEKILQKEMAGWVQEMEDALAELRTEQTKEE